MTLPVPINAIGHPEGIAGRAVGAGAGAMTALTATQIREISETYSAAEVDGLIDGIPIVDLSGYVPYTGATADLDLGAFGVTAIRGYFGAGTVAAPSITFAADTNTGIYNLADQLRFSSAGADRLALTSNVAAFYVPVRSDVIYALNNNLNVRNGTTAQAFSTYSTYTSTTSFESLKIQSQTAGSYQIGSAVGSAGGTNRDLEFGRWDSAGTFNAGLRISSDGRLISNGIYIGAHNYDGQAFYKESGSSFMFSSTPSTGSRGFGWTGVTAIDFGTRMSASTWGSSVWQGSQQIVTGGQYVSFEGTSTIGLGRDKKFLWTSGDGRNGLINGQGEILLGRDTSGVLRLSGVNSTEVSFVIDGITAQTANLQEWRDSSGTVLTSVGPTGFITCDGGLSASLFLGEVDPTFAGSRQTAVGVLAKASSAQGTCVAVGFRALATGWGSTAIGAWTIATGEKSLAISGNNNSSTGAAEASGQLSIAIGASAKATALGAIMIGAGTNSTSYSFSVGNFPVLCGSVVASNGTTPTSIEARNTYTSSTSFETFRVKANTGAAYQIGSAIGSAGGTNRDLEFGTWDSAGTWTAGLTVGANGNLTLPRYNYLPLTGQFRFGALSHSPWIEGGGSGRIIYFHVGDNASDVVEMTNGGMAFTSSSGTVNLYPQANRNDIMYVRGGDAQTDAFIATPLHLSGGRALSGNLNGGGVFLFGGVGSGTGVNGDIHFNYNGTVAVGEALFHAKATLTASTTSASSINIPSGVAPTAPADGDIWSNGTALLHQASGTARTIATLNTQQAWSSTQYAVVDANTFAATFDDDTSAGSIKQKMTLSADITAFTMSAGVEGQTRIWYFLQDGTGGWTITFSGIDGTEPTIDTDADALTVVEMEYVAGTGWRFV
jgi:hypothetical protein